MSCTTIEPSTTMMPFAEVSIDLDDFIMEAENFIKNSEYQYQRTFTDFVDENEECSFMNKAVDKDIMYAPADLELVKKVIGYKGYNFINITEKTGIEKIWHNRKSNVFEFTGGNMGDRLRAMTMVRNKLDYYIRGRHMKNQPVPENMYSYAGNTFYTPMYLSTTM